MKPYKPSGKAPLPGLIRIGLATTLGNAIAGGLFHLLGRLIYVVLVFPMLMGATAGGLAFAATYGGKIRNPIITIFSGVLGGLILYGGMHGADYLQFRDRVATELAGDSGSNNDGDTGRTVDQYLENTVGDTGFVGYLKHAAEEGVVIGKFGNEGINLGGTGSWAFWIVELFVIELVAGAFAYGASTKAFCEECDQWYGNDINVGSVPPEQAEAFLAALKNGSPRQAGALVGPMLGTIDGSLQVSKATCPPCPETSDTLLTVLKHHSDHKGKHYLSRRVTALMVSPRDYQRFTQGMKQDN